MEDTSKQNELLEWAILAPASVDELKAVAEEVNPPLPGWGDTFVPAWTYAECSSGHSALLNQKPGTRDTYESAIAKQLSSLTGKPAYVVYTEEESGILVYENGECTGELDDDPFEFALSMGCSLPGDTSRSQPKKVGKAVAVVEGVSAQQAAKALGFDAPPDFPGYDLRIIDGPTGAIISRDNMNDLVMTATDLTEKFPEKDIYTLSVPSPGRFIAWLVRDGRNVGSFEIPTSPSTGTPPLESIRGRTTPQTIAQELGVPLELLGID